MFHHKERNLKTMVHGDDYVTAGMKEDLQWMKKVLEADYEIKTQLLGPEESTSSKGETMEGKVLNRVIRATADGWQLEVDPRHAELIAEQMGVQNGKGLITPGVDEEAKDEDTVDKELKGQDVTLFRGTTT